MKQNLLIDYLVMSFKISDKQACFLDFLLNKIKFPLVDAIHIRSFYGLGDCLYYSGVKVHYDKNLVILDCSGIGCRTLEQLNSDWNWGSFLAIFDKFLTVPIKDLDYGGERGVYAVHISRLSGGSSFLFVGFGGYPPIFYGRNLFKVSSGADVVRLSNIVK